MKNKFKNIFLTAGVISFFVMSSCTKKLDEAYPNPNASIKQPVELILPSVIGSIVGSSSAAGSAFGLANDGLLIGRYIQFWGTYSASSSAMSLTTSTASNYDRMAGTLGASDLLGSMWGAHYYSMGQNVNRIIEWGSEEQKWDFVGAAWALRAWSLLETTNQYGEIILRQAFNTSLEQFNYEDQSEVYDSVRATCFRALSFLNMTGGNMNPTNFTNSDFYFNKGDLNKWKKFVYGILARSYAYIQHKHSSYPDSVIKYASLSCANNNDNIICTFQATGITGTSNFYGSARGNVNTNTFGIRQTSFIANLMNGTNPGAFTGAADPRRPYLLRENRLGTYTGLPSPWIGINSMPFNEEPQSFVGTYATYSSTAPYPAAPATAGGYASPEQGRYIFRDAAPWPVMTASEMQFLIAEANVRKNGFVGNAAALAAYTNAISLNFDMLTSLYNTNVPAAMQITPAAKAAYLANPAVVPTSPSGLNLTMIMLQKYIAMYGWGIQVTWADMRRYHYTDLDPATGAQVYAGFTPPSGTFLHASNNGKLVYRCRPRYNSEYLYNIPALSAVGAYPVNNDYHTKETWFSKP